MFDWNVDPCGAVSFVSSLCSSSYRLGRTGTSDKWRCLLHSSMVMLSQVHITVGDAGRLPNLFIILDIFDTSLYVL